MSEDTEQPGPEPAADAPEAAVPADRGCRAQPEPQPVAPESGSSDRRERETAPSSFSPPGAPSYPPPSWSAAVRVRHRAAHPAPRPPRSPFSYSASPHPTFPGTPPASSATAGGRPGKFRSWLPVVVVAALIGGAIGAGVTAIADHNNSGGGSNVTIHESGAAPGAAVLSGNVTIPQLVDKVIHSVVSIDVKSDGNEDEGTGMIITSDGEVITNNHVIELYSEGGDTGSITVTEYGQTKALPTTLVGYDQTEGCRPAQDQQRVEPAHRHLRRLVQNRRGRRRGGNRQRARAGRRHAHGHPGHHLGVGALGDRRRRGHRRPRRCRT